MRHRGALGDPSPRLLDNRVEHQLARLVPGDADDPRSTLQPATSTPDPLKEAGGRERRIRADDDVDVADVYPNFEGHGRDTDRSLVGAEPLLHSLAFCLGEAAVVAVDRHPRETPTSVRGRRIDLPSAVDEDEDLAAVVELFQAVDRRRGPYIIGPWHQQHLCSDVPLPLHRDDPAGRAQVSGSELARLRNGRRHRHSLDLGGCTWAGERSVRVESLQHAAQLVSPWCPVEEVNLVKDHRTHLTKPLAPEGQQRLQGLRRGHEKLRRVTDSAMVRGLPGDADA